MSEQRCLAAAILAGGRARRLGEIDKSALTIDGVSIMARLLGVLESITPHVFAVGDQYGAAAAAGLRVVQDEIPDGGPLGGIYTAIVHSPCDRTLIVGCDMPFLTGRFLTHLMQRSQTLSVMPRTARGYEPLCAIYTRESAAAIRDRLDRGERQAACLPGTVQVIEVGPEELAAFDPDGLLFVNVNTPHDYAQARSGQAPLKLRKLDEDPITDV
jgi:molybdopterin-guanine dinucleotide biosynthesis protein A